ncbi:hypothetical protein AGMMS50212_03020 [Spirochaetia bacterium]|nr:hypothetical protein AGMMS50212_03020 [Spirochaetia bacterium]
MIHILKLKILASLKNGPKELLKGILYFAYCKIATIINAMNFKSHKIFCSTLYNYGEKINPFVLDDFDYIRNVSLELVAHDIKCKNITGSVAELGVYRGGFARYINMLFPNRKLYLFDTFEGFDSKDVQTEIEKAFSKADEWGGGGVLTATSIELVMSQMKYPQNVVIKKGYFPDTAKDLNENFVFVSLDVDLFAPTMSGLCFFYPILQKGGCIFIHDYNNKGCSGVKEAVRKFCAEYDVPYFQLADWCGSVIIMK